MSLDIPGLIYTTSKKHALKKLAFDSEKLSFKAKEVFEFFSHTLWISVKTNLEHNKVAQNLLYIFLIQCSP